MKSSGKRVFSSFLALILSCSLVTTSVFASTSVLSDETKEYTQEVTKQLSDEGLVLLENEMKDSGTGNTTGEKALPIASGSKICVFGNAQLKWQTISFYNGLGTDFVDLMTALRSKFDVDETLATEYKDSGAAASPTGTEMDIDDETLDEAESFSDTAIVVIGRKGSEGSEGTDTAGSYRLSASENEMIDKVNAKFNKVIVVLNIPRVIDTQWIKDKHIDAALVAWYGGNQGANSLADILAGDVNPSGRLVDTFAKQWSDYPSSAHWADGDGKDSQGNPHVYYNDDIYVGYRYFETYKVPVTYEFGYGLSYTDFKLSDYKITVNSSGKVVVNLKATNIGTMAGKEVVQIYYALPDTATDAGIDSPSKQLAAYGKTDLLDPGQSQDVSISYDFKNMAAYSETEAAYKLYAGSYKIMVGTSVKNIQYSDSVPCTATVSTEVLSHELVPQEKIKVLDGTIKDSKAIETGIIRRYDPKADNTNTSVLGTGDTIDATIYDANTNSYQLTDVSKETITLSKFVDGLSLEELVTLTSGLPDVTFMGTPTINGKSYADHNHTAPTGDTTNYQVTGRTSGISSRSISQLTMADRQETIGYYTESTILGDQGFQVYPSNTLNACTWNLDLANKYGIAVAKECKEAGIDIFLAPSMNIHRNPLGGRNAEYFSEDPVVAGTMAASQVRGVQSLGISVSLKHFSCNNQETNRQQVNEIISERALREIYLKPFEIAVKTAKPDTIMTSYNKINGAYSPANYSMLQKITRDEWGFSGFFMTDWGHAAAVNDCLVAGNDLIMGSNGNLTDLYESVLNGTVPLKYIKQAATNILNVVLKSDEYYKKYEPVIGTKPAKYTYNPGSTYLTVVKSNDTVEQVTATPPAGTYDSAQLVILSSSTDGASIYYTTDDSTPTALSNKYSAPITVSTSETIKAIAVKDGMKDSDVAIFSYVIKNAVAKVSSPTASPAAGTYSSKQTIMLSSTTDGAIIYYTTDGSTPTVSSNKYSAPITVSTSETIKAIAVKDGMTNSDVATFRYIIQSGSNSSSGSKHSSGGSSTTSTNTGSSSTIAGSTITTSSGTYVTDTTMDVHVKVNYTIKFNSSNGKAPNVVLGTSGVFNTQLTTTDGKNYYVKLISIGQPGAQAGVFLDGVKLFVATVETTATTSNVKSDTTLPFKVKAGASYIIKLTAPSRPTLVSGTSGAFKVELVKTFGNEYFFKVTSIGKTGASSGFYINSDKSPVAVATIA